MYDFDTNIDRRHSDSEKWGKYSHQDIIPMWVADTDFQSPQAVIDALHARVDHGVFGYSNTPAGLIEIIIKHMQSHYHWKIDADWLVFLPGLVCGLNLSVRAFTQENQRTLSPHPIYPPFMKSSQNAKRDQLPIPVKRVNQRWIPDFSAIEAHMQGNEKLLMLCNPLNPGGTVFTRQELLDQLAFAQQHNLVICSDEIHCDLILQPGIKHIPIASLNKDAEQRTITLLAPSKTYNIAGLGASIAIIANPQLRQSFIQQRQGIIPSVDLLAYVAAEAAYRDGQNWLDAQLAYLRENRDYVIKRINAIPQLHIDPFDATYLAWIDASQLPVENPHVFFEKAGVGLSSGADFGNKKFVRLNFGCTKQKLTEALDRIEKACAAL